MPIPIIASDMTITSTSTVSQVGMRFAGCVIACPSAATLWTGSARVAVNGFTCVNNRRHHHDNACQFAIPLVAGYRNRRRLSSVAALARDSRVAPSMARRAFVFLASVARMSAATSGVVVHPRNGCLNSEPNVSSPSSGANMPRALLVVLAVLLSAHGAQAEMCSRVGTYKLSLDADWPMYISTKAGATCEATFGSFGGANLTFKRLLLVTPPARGKIKLREGGYYIYTAPSSQGPDKFTLRVCGAKTTALAAHAQLFGDGEVKRIEEPSTARHPGNFGRRHPAMPAVLCEVAGKFRSHIPTGVGRLY